MQNIHKKERERNMKSRIPCRRIQNHLAQSYLQHQSC
jgi:hypothetical protein